MFWSGLSSWKVPQLVRYLFFLLLFRLTGWDIVILKNEFISQRFYKENKSHPSVSGSGRRIIAAHSLLFLWIIQSEETNSVDTNYWPVEEYFCLCVCVFFLLQRGKTGRIRALFFTPPRICWWQIWLLSLQHIFYVHAFIYFFLLIIAFLCVMCARGAWLCRPAVAPVPPLQQSLTPEPRQLGYRRKPNLHIWGERGEQKKKRKKKRKPLERRGRNIPSINAASA